MQRWAVFGLTLLAACSGGGGQVVLSGGPEFPTDGGGIISTPDSGPLGHESFALLINDVRAENGVAIVMENTMLNAAASAHAQDMVDNNYLAHTNLDGMTPGDRATAAGYDWDFMAENIAQGFFTEGSVVDAWMNSPGHRDNMVDPRPQEFGLGRDGSTWVLMLGSPDDTP
jgi:uncharacterized protein YkwD